MKVDAGDVMGPQRAVKRVSCLPLSEYRCAPSVRKTWLMSPSVWCRFSQRMFVFACRGECATRSWKRAGRRGRDPILQHVRLLLPLPIHPLNRLSAQLSMPPVFRQDRTNRRQRGRVQLELFDGRAKREGVEGGWSDAAAAGDASYIHVRLYEWWMIRSFPAARGEPERLRD